MFYDRFVYLCRQRDVAPSRAAVEAGISKSLVTKWKTHQTEIPSPDVISKLSKYFGVPVSALLGEEADNVPSEQGRPTVSDEDIKFALFGGRTDITEAMYEEVKNFARFIAQREQ